MIRVEVHALLLNHVVKQSYCLAWLAVLAPRMHKQSLTGLRYDMIFLAFRRDKRFL